MSRVYEAALRYISLPRCGTAATPYFRSYEVGPWKFGQAVAGHVNPAVSIPDQNVVGVDAVNAALVGRYGPGFGTPGKAAPSALFAAFGYGSEEGRELPNAETLKILGLPEVTTDPTEVWDWRVLSDFTRLVVQPLNRKLAPGTPQSEWPVPLPPPPPPVLPPPAQLPPLASGLHPLSPAGVRVEELLVVAQPILFKVPWVWAVVGIPPAGGSEEWKAVKPFAVEALRFYRRLRAKLGDTRAIPAEDR